LNTIVTYKSHRPEEAPFKVGDTVRLDPIFGRTPVVKIGLVLGIRQRQNCESGWMVQVDFYGNELDSNWLKKYNKMF
jgi:hypothetical protein